MTNTKFRKRALLSSVAMLLVALVALGSATFAWFTQNTSATANNLYATTVKASSLKISKWNHSWGNSVTYSQGSDGNLVTMFPASSANGTTWCEAVSDNADTGAYKTASAKEVTPSDHTSAKFVYKDQLNIQNAGSGSAPAINNVTITVNWPEETAAYARFALVPVTDDTYGTETFDFEEGKGFKDYVYAQSAVTYDGRSDNTTTQSITTKTTVPVISTLTAGQSVYFDLFVWFEGQDPACKDINAGQTLEGLSFTVNGTPVAN